MRDILLRTNQSLIVAAPSKLTDPNNLLPVDHQLPQTCEMGQVFTGRLLVIVPTGNPSKVGVITEKFQDAVRAANTSTEVFVIVRKDFKSDVNEQPYNEAGRLGAQNRLAHATRWLHSDEGKAAASGATNIFIATIENYIAEESDRCVDYGKITIQNMRTGKTVQAQSDGVVFPTAYVEEAKTYGIEQVGAAGDTPVYGGNVTAGSVLAHHVRGLKADDPPLVLAGVSRYELLVDAMRSMPIPV